MNMQVSYDFQSLAPNPNVVFNHFKALQSPLKHLIVNQVYCGLQFSLLINATSASMSCLISVRVSSLVNLPFASTFSAADDSITSG
jgi:hypothetical protein